VRSQSSRNRVLRTPQSCRCGLGVVDHMWPLFFRSPPLSGAFNRAFFEDVAGFDWLREFTKMEFLKNRKGR
jgi:hypothetical protein